MHHLRSRWNNFWFQPDSPTNLAVCRILFFGGMFLYYLPQDFSVWSEVSRGLWQPVWLFRVLQLPVLSAETLTGLQVLWKCALFLAALGLGARGSTVAAFLLGAYLLGLPQNFGKVRHSDALLVLVMASMAWSHCGAAWSLDEFVRARRGGVSRFARVSGEYTWPVRAVWLLMSLVFFAAGVAKLRLSGLEWITSDWLSQLLIDGQYQIGRNGPSRWGLDLAQCDGLCHALAALTIVLEVGFPLAMFSRTARWLFVPSMLGLQIGIRVCMGPAFDQYLLCYLFWVPWDRVLCLWRSFNRDPEHMWEKGAKRP